MTAKRFIMTADGASRGNPGPAAIGAAIRDEEGRVVARISRRIGVATNNQAEYRALIAGLKEALRLGARAVDIRLDSELVVRQVSGRYRVKNAALLPLFQEARQLVGRLEEFSISHIPGSQNADAHRLADVALQSPG